MHFRPDPDFVSNPKKITWCHMPLPAIYTLPTRYTLCFEIYRLELILPSRVGCVAVSSQLFFSCNFTLLACAFSLSTSFLVLNWLWMGSLHENILLMLVFLKALFSVLLFSYYSLMTFLMILSVILLCMMMILPSVLSVSKHLVSGSN